MTTHPALPAVALFAASLLTVRGALAKDYPVKLSRPDKVGLKYRLDARETKKNSMSIHNGAALLKNEESKSTVTLRAVVEILKVTKKGEPLEKQVTVESFSNEKDESLLKKGDVVTAKTVDGKTVFRLGDRELPGRAAEFLGDLVKTKTTSMANDDEVFGSKTRRKIGENWKCNAELLAKDLKLKPSNISGTVTLQALEKHAGEDCLRIGIELNMNAAPRGAKLGMNGFKVKSADVRMKIGGLVPVNPASRSGSEWMRAVTKAEWIGDTPARKDFAVRLHNEVTMNATLTYLK